MFLRASYQPLSLVKRELKSSKMSHENRDLCKLQSQKSGLNTAVKFSLKNV